MVFELEVGIRKSSSPEKRRSQLDEFLDVIHILPFDHRAATVAARIRAKLEEAGTPIGPFDTLIAGTALASDGILVTHNTQEFQRIPDLRIADWYNVG